MCLKSSQRYGNGGLSDDPVVRQRQPSEVISLTCFIQLCFVVINLTFARLKPNSIGLAAASGG